MARSPLTVDARRRLYEEDSKWSVKAVLRIIATGAALLAMILFAVAVSYENKNFVNTDGAGDWTDGLALAPVVTSLLYNPIALALLIVVRKGRHFHPAWHLGMDLLVWALCIPAIIFSVGGGLFWYWAPAIVDRNGNIDCGFFFNEFSPECDPVAYTIGRTEIAGIVFLFFVFVLHFMLFVFACIDTHKWRRASQGGQARKSFELQYNNDSEQHAPPSYVNNSESIDPAEGVTKYV